MTPNPHDKAASWRPGEESFIEDFLRLEQRTNQRCYDSEGAGYLLLVYLGEVVSSPSSLKVIQLLTSEVDLEFAPAILVSPLEVLDRLHDRFLHHGIGIVADEGSDESGEILWEVVWVEEDHAGGHLDGGGVDMVRLFIR